ncbi:MAG: hypothetical protein GC150_15430 [Rhizobiales bacterium]|nr:hypothetical protein [Hyphomicrobiales bacterium]
MDDGDVAAAHAQEVLDDAIAAARRAALPSATRCVRCQTVLERGS